MVKINEKIRERVIRETKFRIKHYEKHGCGNNVIEEKDRLKKQERHHQLVKEKENK